MTNAPLPTELHPRLIVDGVDKAISFYQAAFGAELVERFVMSGIVVHAAIRIGRSVVSMAEQVPDWKLLAPPTVGGSSVLLYVTLPDPDATCSRFVELGGEVVIAIKDRPYGKREGRVRDPFGHLWVLSRPIETLNNPEIQRRLDSQEAK